MCSPAQGAAGRCREGRSRLYAGLQDALPQGVQIDLPGGGNHDEAHPLGNLAPLEDLCGLAKIIESPVGAAAYDHLVDLDAAGLPGGDDVRR